MTMIDYIVPDNLLLRFNIFINFPGKISSLHIMCPSIIITKMNMFPQGEALKQF